MITAKQAKWLAEANIQPDNFIEAKIFRGAQTQGHTRFRFNKDMLEPGQAEQLIKNGFTIVKRSEDIIIETD